MGSGVWVFDKSVQIALTANSNPWLAWDHFVPTTVHDRPILSGREIKQIQSWSPSDLSLDRLASWRDEDGDIKAGNHHNEAKQNYLLLQLLLSTVGYHIADGYLHIKLTIYLWADLGR
jgi:hypothetical protein